MKSQSLDVQIKSGAIQLGRGKIISSKDITNNPGDYPIYSSSAQGKGEFGRYSDYMFDEELITWSVDGGGRFFFRPKHKFSVTNVCGFMRISDDIWDRRFVYYSLDFQHQRLAFDYQMKAHPSVIRNLYVLSEYPRAEQKKIAEILSTIDRAIEQTEALIAKQQRIKTGLMQDLLTRGIDEHGNLRSEQTHQFKDSPLGRIPVEWEVDEFGHTIESAVDGPFGSNLKSDHYVAEPGVRVIRLGNIGNGKFLDQDKAWISNAHGRYLSRHAVQPMDMLIASLGDERHPFGRACIYADYVHEAIVKADVFRVRCKRNKFVHSFAVHLFNFPRWRQGLFALAQGVTRDRVNLTNMMLLQLPIPTIIEQKTIAHTISSIDVVLDEFGEKLSKLRSLKTALMQDLLTGRKRITALLKRK